MTEHADSLSDPDEGGLADAGEWAAGLDSADVAALEAEYARSFPFATIVCTPPDLIRRRQRAVREQLRAGEIDEAEYEAQLRAARLSAVRALGECGLFEAHAIPADFTHGSGLLDALVTLGFAGGQGAHVSLGAYFEMCAAMAGPPSGAAVQICGHPRDAVPRPGRLQDLFAEARDEAGIELRVPLVGPAAVLCACGVDPVTGTAAGAWAEVPVDELVNGVAGAYSAVLAALVRTGVVWVQIADEGVPPGSVAARVWERIAGCVADEERPRIFGIGVPDGVVVEAQLVSADALDEVAVQTKPVVAVGTGGPETAPESHTVVAPGEGEPAIGPKPQPAVAPGGGPEWVRARIRERDAQFSVAVAGAQVESCDDVEALRAFADGLLL